jgi:hypothetical protein
MKPRDKIPECIAGRASRAGNLQSSNDEASLIGRAARQSFDDQQTVIIPEFQPVF